MKVTRGSWETTEMQFPATRRPRNLFSHARLWERITSAFWFVWGTPSPYAVRYPQASLASTCLCCSFPAPKSTFFLKSSHFFPAFFQILTWLLVWFSETLVSRAWQSQRAKLMYVTGIASSCQNPRCGLQLAVFRDWCGCTALSEHVTHHSHYGPLRILSKIFAILFYGINVRLHIQYNCQKFALVVFLCPRFLSAIHYE